MQESKKEKNLPGAWYLSLCSFFETEGSPTVGVSRFVVVVTVVVIESVGMVVIEIVVMVVRVVRYVLGQRKGCSRGRRLRIGE